MTPIELLASPRLRAQPCAPPCGFCGGDGSVGILTGAALCATRTFAVSAPLERLGLWLVRPASVTSLHIVVTGSAIEHGDLAPTAVRVRAEAGANDVFWRGAALARNTHAELEGRAFSARLTGLEGSLLVLDVAGICRSEVEGSIVVRAVAEGVGCLVGRSRVRVTDAERPLSLEFHGELSDARGSQAAAIEAIVATTVESLAHVGHDGSRLALRVSKTQRGALSSIASCGPSGLCGIGWVHALKLIARGRCTALAITSGVDPEAFDLQVWPRCRGGSLAARISLCVDVQGVEEAGREAFARALTARWEALGVRTLPDTFGDSREMRVPSRRPK